MNWVKGECIGRGSFGTVNLAIPIKNSSLNPPLMVVKSSPLSNSDSLMNERIILSELQECPQVIRILGHNQTSDSAGDSFNLFLEHAGKGSLSDQLRLTGGFADSVVRRYTKSILKGLCYIHEMGFVHCDVKLQNLLLFQNEVVKVADFGLAMKVGEKREKGGFVGTPLYMSPELVAGGEGRSPADVWALGCAVVEMVTGKPAWRVSPECDVSALLYRIGVAGETPEIPASLGDDGRDFLLNCFIRDPNERWTARMLLDHPFVSGSVDSEDFENKKQDPLTSPRCPFDFSMWTSTESSDSEFEFSSECLWSRSVMNRVGQLGSDPVHDWSDCDEWVSVR